MADTQNGGSPHGRNILKFNIEILRLLQFWPAKNNSFSLCSIKVGTVRNFHGDKGSSNPSPPVVSLLLTTKLGGSHCKQSSVKDISNYMYTSVVVNQQ